MFGETLVDQGPQATLGISGRSNSVLAQLMLEMDIEPGTQPSYELCKKIFTTHILGAKMTSGPITVAQSQKRILSIPGGPEEILIEAFEKEWSRIGADQIIHNVMTLSRIYGIATLSVLARRPNGSIVPTDVPLELDDLQTCELFFNQLDPLNTSGSLVLNQDPNALDFMKPVKVQVGGRTFAVSRVCVVMNEQPIWIDWTNSAFGFVGRSVYQRALYPMKSLLQSMISDQSLQEKLMVLVYKMISPGSVLDNIAKAFGVQKRSSIKYSKSGNVVSIGDKEDLGSLNLERGTSNAGEYSRKNILDNIATAAGMPAVMLNQETLAEGFGEGTEDAKIIARFIDRIRIEMEPLYRFMSDIVMARAWNPDFYASLQSRIKAYKSIEYKTAFYDWKNNFEAKWPNLLTEPDSEKAKKSDIRLKSVIALVETLTPILDPENKATFIEWVQTQINQDEFLFDGELNLDVEALATYQPPNPFGTPAENEEREPERPRPFSYES